MITSPSNPRVVEAARLHRVRRRRESGRALLEGPHLLAEALDAAVEVEVVFAIDMDEGAVARASAAGVEVLSVGDRVLAHLAGTETPRGPVAVIHVPPNPRIAGIDTIVLSDISDPGNAGSLIRSAAAFGFAVVNASGSVDPWSPKVLRSGAGGHFLTPVLRTEQPLDALRAAGCVIVGLVVSGGMAPSAIPTDVPIALWVGSEAHGLPDPLVGNADVLVTLDMPGGTESLNVAVAGAIAMYERRRLAG